MADTMKSWNSPASKGASSGMGSVEGAGELPSVGPGKAAANKGSPPAKDMSKTSGRGSYSG